MTTWVVPPECWQTDLAKEGDFLLRHEGDNVLIARVSAAAAEWLGPVRDGALDLPSVSEPTPRPDLDGVVAPMAQALANLGG